MKKIYLLLLLGLPVLLRAQSHSLEKSWETDTIVAVPESVLPDASHSFLFVSLIDGGPWDADGKGGVGKLSLDGKHYAGERPGSLPTPIRTSEPSPTCPTAATASNPRPAATSSSANGWAMSTMFMPMEKKSSCWTPAWKLQ